MSSPRVREEIERLAGIERGSASEGEARAARVLAGMLRERGLEPVLEEERAVGDFWLATGLAAGAGALAGLIGRRSRRAGALLGAAAAGLMADDVDNGAHLLRRLLPERTTTNVLAWAGDPEGAETVVLIAHHDAARTGLLFHPGLVPLVNRLAPGWYARQTTSTQTGRLLVAGPALVALGSALGLRRVRRLGTVWSAGTAALLADVGRSAVVPGANDNLSAVAVLLMVAEELARGPVPGVRVLLLSTGSEESFMEGMRGFVRRHGPELDPTRTRFVALECVGSPRLMIMEGEGMLRMRDHDRSLREELQAAADEAGVEVWRGLRLGAGGTDALPALRAGYRAACVAACTELKVPANYHWPTDVPENLCWSTIEEAATVVTGLLGRVGRGATAGARGWGERCEQGGRHGGGGPPELCGRRGTG
ncbi:MAG TPA: M28 family peptidase [Solirubrobacteraceae bacterium]|nr:M28 family peptidase [Solirubrobacteraceae bacterium]